MPTALTTERLSLGPWHDDDLDDYARMVFERDPRAAAAPRDGGPTRDTMRARLARQQTAPASTGIGLFVIRVNGRFVGYCGLVLGRSNLDEPELAYELLRAEHGKGYATEAARAVVEAAAGTGRARLWARVRLWNDASFGVLEKVGFSSCGRVTTDDFGDSAWWTREL